MSISALMTALQERKVEISLTGNDQLKIVAPEGSIGPEMIAQIREHKEALIRSLKKREVQSPLEIPCISPAQQYEVSHAQRRLWILHQLDESKCAYNIFMGYELNGKLNKECLKTAFTALITRHEILRTVFVNDAAGLWQKVLEPRETGFNVIEIAMYEGSEQEKQQQLSALSAAGWKHVFDLHTGPLLQVQLVALEAQRHVVLIGMHHIISDGWSLEIMMEELVQLYESAVTGTNTTLPELRIQYKDFSNWQNRLFEGPEMRVHKQYWSRHLGGELPVLNLATDMPRPAQKTYAGTTRNRWLDNETYQLLRALLRNQRGTSIFMALVAGVKALLFRYTGQEDIILGTPVAGRSVEALSGQIGCYMNTLVFRTRFNGQESFDALLEQVKEVMLNAYGHEMYPFDKLVEDLGIVPDQSRSVLFDALITYRRSDRVIPADPADSSSAGEPTQELQMNSFNTDGHESSKFDLAFNFTEYGDGLLIDINYSTALFYEERIDRMLLHLQELLKAVCRNSLQPLSAITFITKEERETLLYRFNETTPVSPAALTIHGLFEVQVARSPKTTALVCAGENITYEALNHMADKIAAALYHSHGVRPGHLVGIMMDRSVGAIASLLGILKCGAAYVPIDPAYPEERIRYMADNSQARIILTDEHYTEIMAATAGGYTDYPQSPADTNSLAYIIYTSGSTGTPKGVMIEHHAVLNLLKGLQQEMQLRQEWQYLLTASLSFDAAVKQVFIPLTTGATLHICRDTADVTALVQYIRQQHINVLHAMPMLWKAILAEVAATGGGTALCCISSGGDELDRECMDQLKRQFPTAAIYNTYGPTEICVNALLYDLQQPGAQMPLLGKCLPGYRAYITDQQGNLVPVGYPGELCIAGTGLARGYLGQEQLTQERFVADPYKPGALMYRTGDLARRTWDGNIEFLGRNDHQVKIRGYRIETGEIERVLQNLTGVREAVVTAWKSPAGEKELVSYIVWDAEQEEEVLRDHLHRYLPKYMHPAHYIALDSLPLTGNGKVDRSRLPAPLQEISSLMYEAPRNAQEAQLVLIWEEILQRTGIGIHDNFFDHGGHSLKGMRMLWRIRQEFGVDIPFRELFSHPTINGLSGWLLSANATGTITMPAPEPLPPADKYALSHAQQRLWILDQLEETVSAYNILTGYELKGSIDVTLLDAAFKALVQRHEILRTVIRSDAEGPWQYVLSLEESGFEMIYTDLSRDKITLQQQKLAAITDAESAHKFELDCAPLFKVQLVQLSAAQYILLMNMHHIITDGWSIDVLLADLVKLYLSAQEGGKSALPSLPVQYKDYAAWQHRLLTGAYGAAHRSYWQEKLGDDLPVLDLPTDYTRPRLKTFNGATEQAWLDKSSYEGLQACLRSRSGTSMFMLLVAGLKALCYRYTGQEDIVIGTPVTGRDHEYLSGQVGFYVNTLVLRTRFNGNGAFSQLLDQVQETILNAYEHQYYPFDKLLEDLDIAPDRSRSALFDVMVSYERVGTGSEQEPDALQVMEYDTGEVSMSKFDLTVHFTEHADRIAIAINYNTDLFSRERIISMQQHLSRLLQAVAHNMHQPLPLIPYLGREEEEELLVTFNNTAIDYPRDATIHSLFESQAARNGHATAVVFGATQLTYATLNDLANRVAARLQQAYGVGGGSLVGVMMDRSDQLITCLLGILKCGAAYVPIDPEYPEDRMRYMLEDSRPAVVLVDDAAALFGAIPQTTYRELTAQPYNNGDDYTLPKTAATDLAYVIYTSGSTGRPKGVMVEHRALVNLCYWHSHAFELNSTSKASVYAGVAFDALGWEIWPYLLTGGCLFPVKQQYRMNGALLQTFLDKNNITHAFVPTALYEELGGRLSLSANSNIRLLVGGDKLNRVYPGGIVVNNYGPTESTVVTTSGICTAGSEKITIGKPVGNTRIYIVDKHQRLLPKGYPGELCIAGEGLSRGYLGQEQLTQERFVANPYEAGGRMYKTGDIARWTPDGNIEFLGRNDHQVKIRGYRIETGEIERELQQYAGVGEVVVTTWEPAPGEKELVSYIVWVGSTDEAGLRAWLDLRLPRYMHPAHYVALERLPLTGNGKVDRHALPAPSQRARSLHYESPRNEAQQQLVTIWEEILQCKGIGIHDNFFDQGGHSLKGMRMLWRVSQVFGIDIPFHELFSYPTINSLSGLLSERAQQTAAPLEQTALQDKYAMSHAQRRLWVLDQLEESGAAYNILTGYELKGNIDIALLETAFTGLVQRHEILRTRFGSDEEGQWQYIQPVEKSSCHCIHTNLATQDPAAQARCLSDLREQERDFRFNLAQGPLFRIHIIRLSATHHILLLNLHHIIADGWSMEVLLNDLVQLYTGAALTPLPVQYKDYADWHNRQLTTADIHGRYWREQLAGNIPVLELPADHTRPGIKTYHGAMERIWLNKTVYTGLQSCLQDSNGASMFMLLVAGVKALFYRYTGQEDIVIGTPVAGRDHEYLSGQIGFYVNTLVLRTRFNGAGAFKDLLGKVQEVMLDAYEHQSYPFDKLVEDLDLSADRSRSPLFDVMVSYTRETKNNGPQEREPGLQVTEYHTGHITVSKFDLTVHFTEYEDGLQLSITYNTAIFKQERITRMLEHLRELFTAIGKNSRQPLQELSYISAQEQSTLLEAFNNTGNTAYPANQTIHGLFEAQVLRMGDQPAVIYDNQVLSYAELNREANRFAYYLRREYGVHPGDLVGLMMARSERLMVCLLGILKAGAAYVPIDPEYPADRIAYMLQDSAPKVLVTDSEPAGGIGTGTEVMNTTEEWELLSYYHDGDAVPGNNRSLAYVIYTSGSTGRPKGAMIAHHSVVNLCAWLQELVYAPHAGNLIAMLTASINFDASVQQLFAPLLSGARLVMISETDRRNVERYIQQLKQQRVSVIDITPGYLRVLLEVLKGSGTEDLCLQYILVGGEALPAEDRALFHQVFGTTVQLINVYGVTEATVNSTYEIVAPGNYNSLSIGRPLKNTQVYVLDKQLHPCGIGIPGELCIGGAGVGLGYLGREALTQERFINNPYVAGERLYRTGDLARWTNEGAIEYLGRSDNQAKIRGYRIEPGEIENTLLGYPQVREAVVEVHNGTAGEKELVSYIIWRQEEDGAGLRAWLYEKLPLYMHPSYYITLERLPLTGNGKVDRKQLPPPEAAPATVYEGPRNTTETTLVSIWEAVLQRSPIGIRDNFFAIGGHSLKGIRLMAKVAKAFDRRVSIKELYEYPDIATLAALLDRPETTETLIFPLSRRRDENASPIIFVPPIIGSATIYKKLAAQLQERFACYGMQYKGFSGGAFAGSIEETAALYAQQILERIPSDYFILLGYSMGALIAYETARQLEAQGKMVTLLLVDKELPSLTAGIKISPDPGSLEQLFEKEKANWEWPDDVDDDHLKEMYKASYKSMRAYGPSGPINGDIIAFEAKGRNSAVMQHWQRMTHGIFEHHWLNGNHYQVIQDPQLPAYILQLEYSKNMIH